MIIRRFNVQSQSFRIRLADNRKPLAVCLSIILYNMPMEEHTEK